MTADYGPRTIDQGLRVQRPAPKRQSGHISPLLGTPMMESIWHWGLALHEHRPKETSHRAEHGAEADRGN